VIGQNTIIAGSSQISGYSTVGENVWIGPGATVTNLSEIGDNAKIEIGSVVVDEVRANARVSGNFAVPHLRNIADFMKQRAK
jgi:UDP-3-O-[3-hydroxymyristoyl] glucosamine N-acyltransferase